MTSSLNSPKSLETSSKSMRVGVSHSPDGAETANSMGLSLNLMFSSGR